MTKEQRQTGLTAEAPRPTVEPEHVTRLHARALEEVPVLAGRLTPEAFGEGVSRSVAHRFANESPTAPEIETYAETLHAGDMALAVACEKGDDVAWEHVIMTYRPLLYQTARVLTGDDDAGRELADTLWAELYGVGRTRASVQTGVPRRPLLSYFHGRSKLSTWLRSVLAQRHVDRVRSYARTRPLPVVAGTDHHTDGSHGSDGPTGRTADGPASLDPPDPEWRQYGALFAAALRGALVQLDATDRLRLQCYYAQQMTLAEIGHVFGEHEATVSRKLSRVRKRIREEVESVLTGQHRLTPEEVKLCYQYAVDDPSIDVSQVLEP